MSVGFKRITPEETLSGLWEYHEFEGIGISASPVQGEGEYLLVHSINIDKLFEYELQIARLRSMHKRPVIGIAVVTEDDYFHVLEFISLRALNAAHTEIDVTILSND